jgi:hypothetical protein
LYFSAVSSSTLSAYPVILVLYLFIELAEYSMNREKYSWCELETPRKKKKKKKSLRFGSNFIKVVKAYLFLWRKQFLAGSYNFADGKQAVPPFSMISFQLIII